jgi:hypothetical protein
LSHAPDLDIDAKIVNRSDYLATEKDSVSGEEGYSTCGGQAHDGPLLPPATRRTLLVTYRRAEEVTEQELATSGYVKGFG